MTRRRDIRKSDFSVVESTQANDYFDIVRNGQNHKIKQTDLIADLGVTGSLEARGEITGIPVLTIIGTVNYIRNIVAGSGIGVELSPQDGIEIHHNFTVDTTGVPIVTNASAESPTIRSLQAGTGMSISGSGGIIQISSTTVPASTKTIFVYDIGDFPAAVAGVITLVADTEYKLENDVTTSNRFVMSENTVLSGADESLVTLEYTGTGNMITATDVNIKIKGVYLSCASGTLFDVSSTTNAHTFRFYNCNVICDNVGTIDNLQSFRLDTVDFIEVYTQGFIFSGTFYVILLDKLGMIMASGTGNGITLGTTTVTYFTIDKATGAINTTGYVVSGLANSGNIDSAGLGSIINSRNFGTADFSDNIFPTDNRWEFFLNVGAPNSYDTILATHSGGGATITITTAATPVIIGATWTTQLSSRFTGTSGGRWTYTGKGTSVEITASVTLDVALATHPATLFIYKNGVQIPASAVNRSFTAGSPGNISIIWEAPMATNDYIELWVQDDDSTVDIRIYNATMRIRS